MGMHVACSLRCSDAVCFWCLAFLLFRQAKSEEYGDCFLDPEALPLDKIKVGMAPDPSIVVRMSWGMCWIIVVVLQHLRAT